MKNVYISALFGIIKVTFLAYLSIEGATEAQNCLPAMNVTF